MADTLVSKSSMKSTSGKKYIYNVLFYKRLGKIHKSRADGILSIVCHPSCQITLAFTQDTAHESEDQTCSNSSDEENNDCDDNLNLSSKERNKAIRRKMNNRQTRKNRKRKLYLRQQSKSKSNGITNDNRRVVYLGGILKNEIEISKRAEQNLLSTVRFSQLTEVRCSHSSPRRLPCPSFHHYPHSFHHYYNRCSNSCYRHYYYLLSYKGKIYVK